MLPHNWTPAKCATRSLIRTSGSATAGSRRQPQAPTRLARVTPESTSRSLYRAARFSRRIAGDGDFVFLPRGWGGDHAHHRGLAGAGPRTSSPRAYGAAGGAAPRAPWTVLTGGHPVGACAPYRAPTHAHRSHRYAPTQLGSCQKPGCAPVSGAGKCFAPLVPRTVTTGVVIGVVVGRAIDRKRRNGAPLRCAVPSHNAGVAGSSPAPATCPERASHARDRALVSRCVEGARVERAAGGASPGSGAGSASLHVPARVTPQLCPARHRPPHSPGVVSQRGQRLSTPVPGPSQYSVCSFANAAPLDRSSTNTVTLLR